MRKTAALTSRDLSFWRQNILGWQLLWIKSVFLLNSACSDCPYLFVLSHSFNFHAINKEIWNDSWSFSKINQHFFWGFLHSSQRNYPCTSYWTFQLQQNKQNLIWKIFHCRIVRVFYDWCCVSACAVICIESKKNRRQDCAFWSRWKYSRKMRV